MNVPNEKKPERKHVAKTDIESSVNETEAIVSTEENEDLLHRFVSYGSFLGIVKDVFYILILGVNGIKPVTSCMSNRHRGYFQSCINI